MLVLARKTAESIVIDDTIRVTIVAIKGDRVRLGIEAPPAVAVDRAEVHARRAPFVDVPFSPASAVCDATVDLGGLPAATADDTQH
jgi:carbon storage regulator